MTNKLLWIIGKILIIIAKQGARDRHDVERIKILDDALDINL